MLQQIDADSDHGDTPKPQDEDDLLVTVHRLQIANQVLHQELDRLKRLVLEQHTDADDDSVAWTHFMFQVTLARGGTVYGAPTDYVRACENTPGCRPVTTEMMVRFKRHKKVPTWVIEQLPTLEFQIRPNHRGSIWNKTEQNYLATAHKTNQRIDVLAALCTKEFGRIVTTNSVKGQLYRLGLCEPRH